MRKVWIYAGRRNTERADALADEMRAAGDHVLRGFTKHYHGERHADAALILHDGSNPLVGAIHEGVTDVERFDAPEAPVKPAPQDPAGDEYEVVQAGSWFKLMGPDGQVGKSQRSEAAAWALLD